MIPPDMIILAKAVLAGDESAVAAMLDAMLEVRGLLTNQEVWESFWREAPIKLRKVALRLGIHSLSRLTEFSLEDFEGQRGFGRVSSDWLKAWCKRNNILLKPCDGGL